MSKNIGTYQRLARAVAGLLFLWIGTYGIVHPLGRVAVLVLGVWLIAEAVLAICPLFWLLGVRSVEDKISRKSLFLLFTAGVQSVVAFEWWRAAFGKLSNDFASNLPVIVGYYAGDKNPFPKVVSALKDVVIPNVDVFVHLVQWGQVAVAFGLIIGAGLVFLPRSKWKRVGYYLSVVAAVFGVVMNAAFWLAAGWTGAGTAELNVVMFWVQLLLIYVWLELALRREHEGPGSITEVSGQFIYEEKEIYEIRE
jgi:hypothetical protein